MVHQFNDTQILIGRYLLICCHTFYLRGKNSCPNVSYLLQQFDFNSRKLYCVRVNDDGSYGNREVVTFSDFEFRGFV